MKGQSNLTDKRAWDGQSGDGLCRDGSSLSASASGEKLRHKSDREE